MYKQNNTTNLDTSKRILHWIKRKILLILAAFMIGISNAMYEEDTMLFGNQHQTEQQDKKE